MSRRSQALVDYAGAAGRMSITDVLALGSGWAVQQKIDGWYVHVHLDERGCIERIVTRGGEELRPSGRRSESPAEARARIAAAKERACGRKLTKAREQQMAPRRVEKPGLVDDLIGCHVGAPDSILVGELEAGEAGARAAAARGWRAIHLFDAVRVGGRYLAREPYRVRRDALYRGQSWAENFGAGLPFERDDRGRAHDAAGRFCQAIPRDWRRCPIVEQTAPARAGELWERALVGESEGLVAVRLDAPVGRRRSKVKCKPISTIDAVAIKVDKGGAVMLWQATGTIFTVGARKGIELVEGRVYECAHEGWYESGERLPGKEHGPAPTPKFARLVRARPDLQGARV